MWKVSKDSKIREIISHGGGVESVVTMELCKNTNCIVHIQFGANREIVLPEEDTP